MKRRSCPLFGRCGGCDYINIRYEDELLEKFLTEEKYLSRFCRVSPILPSPSVTGFRCKVQAVCGMEDGRLTSGIYRKGSHRLIPVRSCPLEDERAAEVIGTVRMLANRFRLKAYDEDRGTGDLRHILVRCSFHYDEVLVALVASSAELRSASDIAAALHQRHPYVKSVSVIANAEKTSMVIPAGAEERVVYGKGYIMDRLCGLDFRISASSFYQVNPRQTQRLYELAIREANLTGKETVLDAYCGTGTIGLAAAGQARQVLGVELNAAAVRDAQANARRNHIQNARFVCADAGAYLNRLAGEHIAPDTVFLDPPRSGSTPEFLAALGRLAPPRVVYISCDPATQARDIALLAREGYRMIRAIPVDMFPHTEHVETIVLLQRETL